MNSKYTRTITLIMTYLATFLLVGCNLTEDVKEAVTILNEAIEGIENQSANWQGVLHDTINELEENGHSLVKNDVSNVLSRAISDVGIEARCSADFLRDRVRDDLIRLRSQFTGETLTLTPVFCLPNPRTIDMGFIESGVLNTIEIDGYNLDLANVRVLLVDNGGSRLDVSSHLASPSQYLLTLNLGQNGVPLSTSSERLEFTLTATETRSVNIIQPIPQETTRTLVPETTVRLCPDHIGGDKEFGGNGPNVNASAELFTPNQRELWVRITFRAKETKSDWSEAYGAWEFPVWSGSVGAKITDFSPRSASTATFEDTDHQVDVPTISGSALVRRFEINGDTGGDDIGNCKVNTNDDAFIKVFFNEVQLKYVDE